MTSQYGGVNFNIGKTAKVFGIDFKTDKSGPKVLNIEIYSSKKIEIILKK